MSYILGITSPLSQNAAAALLKDGRIIAAAEEERFTRVKHACNIFYPRNSVLYCLNYANIKINDLDSINVSWASSFRQIRKHVSLFIKKRAPILIPNLIYGVKTIKIIKKYIRNEGYNGSINFYEHHMSHLASAYYCSGFKNSNIMSIDAVGETDSTSLAVGEENNIKIVKMYDFFNSLGILYHNFTKYLNFFPQWHEGKVMGLSSYGVPRHDLSFIIRLAKNSYQIKNSINKNFSYLDLLKNTLRYKQLERYIQKNINLPRGYALSKIGISTVAFPFEGILNEKLGINNEKITYKFTQKQADVAASIQSTYEKALIAVSTDLYENNGIKNFSLAGGCALNCLANYKLLNASFVDNVFIQPAANDAGSALGAALLECAKNEKPKFEMEHAYYGPEFNNDEIKKALNKYKLNYDYYEDIEGITAGLLAKGKAIAWFQGRMEFGPRALGNRSILSAPCGKSIKTKINKIKKRELWRPFGPSIIEEDAIKWLVNARKNAFMTICFKVKEEKKSLVPAIVHVDGTTRPQTVSKKMNKRYYGLIKEFKRQTGIPMVLNTSFNDRSEPIVCTPEDAIINFNKMKLDYMAIGNYLVKKK